MGMREEFSQAYHEKYGRLPQNWSEQEGKFFDAHANGAFWAWQASRAALCVELPPELHAYTGQPQDDRFLDVDRNHTIKQCRQAIESAGVKCK